MEHDFIKLFTPTFFKREKFAEVLIEDCQVPCAVQEDGLVFDRALLDLQAKRVDLPAWVYVKWNDIFSPWHTRPAQRGEWPEPISFPCRYEIIYNEGMTNWNMGKAHTFNRAKRMVDDFVVNGERRKHGTYIVIDNESKEDDNEVYIVYADPSIEEFVHSIPDWTQIA